MTETRTCQNCKQSFTIEPADFDFYKKINVPAPTWCPECRVKRRMVWRNERTLYKRVCDFCKKETLSMYPAGAAFTVYCLDCFRSDRWDPLTYGREIDRGRPFLSQFGELLGAVPRLALILYDNAVDCEYANCIKDSKNVYLGYSVVYSENINYAFSVDKSRDCFDLTMFKNSQLVYESVNGDRCYNSAYLVSSRDCTDSRYLYDCVNCRRCFMSSNLRSKQYVFRNRRLSAEEYEAAVARYDTGDARVAAALYGEFVELVRTALHKYADIVKAAGCTGDVIATSKNARDCFNVYDIEHARFLARSFSAKDIWDVYSCGAGNELMYEGMVTGHNGYNDRFYTYANATRDSQYVDFCHSSSSLFGCAALRNKQYCILNKEYSKEEYEKLVPQIIEHMNTMPYVDGKGRIYKYGEFFPPELSPFAYNETVAQEFFPLTKEKALRQGYRWKDPDPRVYQITKKPEDLPGHIRDIGDDILKETIGCAHEGRCNHQCTTAFRVVPQELEFYRRMNLFLPRLCPNCRHYERLAQRNPMKLWHRTCRCAGAKSENGTYLNTAKHSHDENHCPNEFETPYSPERRETVYCEQCYNAEVV